MPFIAVHACQKPGDEPVAAAVRLHGIFPTHEAADASARRLAAEQLDVQSYVVDQCGRWLRVSRPEDPDSATEVAEVEAPENDDPQSGKMGSVCDLLARRPVPPSTEDTPFQQPANRASRQAEGRDLRQTLDDLLNAPLPTSPVQSLAEYSQLRGRLAALRAFDRRLRELYADNACKCADTRREIASLEDRHPGHRGAYREQYDRALQESGVRRERVGFMRYLDDGEEDDAVDVGEIFAS